MPSGTVGVVQGTLEYLILKTLSVGGKKHGFEILEWIYETTDGALAIEEGSLYPALHRIEKRGLVNATWGVSPKGRRAKYYALSAAGRRELAEEQRRWDAYVSALGKIAAVGEEA